MATPGQAGWSNLGEAIGLAMSGGGSQKTYDETMLRGHRTQKALKDAQKATLEYQSMMDLEEQLEPLFGDRAGAAATILNSGNNIAQTMQGRQRMYQGDALSEAMTRAQGGAGIADINPFLAINEGNVQDVTKVSGNTAYNPTVAPADAMLQTTPYGEAMIHNRAVRTQGQNAAQMAKAANSDRTRAEKQRADDVKAAARDAYYQLRQSARENPEIDIKGITQADIQYALETQGSWQSPDGFEYRIDSDLTPPPAPAPGMPAAPATALSSPASAMSGAPVTEPQGATKPPVAAGNDLSALPGWNDDEAWAAMAGVAPAAAQPAGVTEELPAEARASLREGEITTFRNGQKWTLEGGRAVRVN